MKSRTEKILELIFALVIALFIVTSLASCITKNGRVYAPEFDYAPLKKK